MYYLTILGWVMGMWIGAFGCLWKESIAVKAFGLPEGALPNPVAYFFNMISTWDTVIYVIIIWALNALICWKGTSSIEKTVKIFVPLMWAAMIIMIIRGITLPHGIEGIYLLFTPNFTVMKDISVWQGAFGQIFFTLSLGFGIMTAYASYLPQKSDQTNNALMTSFLNCSFEFLAGLAIFSLLFTFAIVPKASTLAMMFFIIPRGIAEFPQGVILFGIIFFTLLLLAGLSSSISLVEAMSSSIIDKFKVSRKKVILTYSIIGCLGSIAFALPLIVDPQISSNGTLGLTLLDLFDHWAFSYGLLLMGLAECILIGWILGAKKLRESINRYSRLQLGNWYDILIKFIIPAVIIFILGFSCYREFTEGLYGWNIFVQGINWLHILALLFWLLIPTAIAFIFARSRSY